MQIYPRGVTELAPIALESADEVFGFEVRVDISRHTRARTSLRVEIFASADGVRWESAGRSEADSNLDPRDHLGQPRQFWTFGTGFKIPEVRGRMLVRWKGRWNRPQYKVKITAIGGEVEADVIVEPVTETDQPPAPFPYHQSISFIQAVSAHDEGGTGATSADMTTTSGNGIAVSISLYDTFTSLSDSKSNTFSVGNAFASSSGLYQSGQRFAENITGGSSHNFTLVHASGGYTNFFAMEVWDMVLSSSFDENASGSGGAVTTGTLAQAREMAVGMIGPGPAAPLTYAVGDGFVELYNVPNSSLLGLCVGYRVTRSTAAVTWDPFHSQVDPIRQVMTFKEKAVPATIETKPSGTTPSIVNTSPAWHGNTAGWWLLNENSAISDGAADISGNGRHLTAFKEGAHAFPALTSEQIGAGRIFSGDNTDVNGLESAVSSALSLAGAMSVMVVWRNNLQPFTGVSGTDPTLFGAAAESTDNCFTLCYNRTGTGRHKFGWFDDAGASGWVSNKEFNDQDDWTVYRLMITRSGAGDGSTERFYYQALDGRSGVVKDVDTVGTDDANGGTAAFTLGMARWNTGPTYTQGILAGLYEARLWSVELSEATVAAYFAEPYLEFESAGTDVTVNVTGVSATGSVGDETVSIAVSVSASGVSATGSVGNETASTSVSISVTGVSATGSVGDETVSTGTSVTVNPTGVQATGSVGDETVSIAVSVTPTGVQATGSVGDESVVINVSVSATGVSGSGAVGDLTVNVGGSVTVNLSGVQAAGSVGNLSVTGTANVTLSGVQATGSVGTVTAVGGSSVTVNVTGVAATGAVGTVDTFTGMVVFATGVSAAGAVGSVAVSGNASVIVSGSSAAGAVGSVLAESLLEVFVTGVEATTGLGSVDAFFGITVFPAGVVGFGQVGTVEITGVNSAVELEGSLFVRIAPLVSGRLYPNIFPQPPAIPVWPSIRYTIISETPAPDLCGDDVLFTPDSRIQFDIVAEKYKQVREVRQQMLNEFISFPIPNLYDSEFNVYDTETKTHRCAVEMVFYQSSDPE